MAVKTFTTGEVLTSADTNTYLANSGLVYVKSQTIGSAVSSVTVSDAFSSTYDDYVINISGGTASGLAVLGLSLQGLTSSSYYQSFVYTGWNNTISADSGLRTSWVYCGSGSSGGLQMQATLLSPFLNKNTRCNAMGSSSSTVFVGNLNGWVDNTTSYTGFVINPNIGTLTGGTITVYGYRKA